METCFCQVGQPGTNQDTGLPGLHLELLEDHFVQSGTTAGRIDGAPSRFPVENNVFGESIRVMTATVDGKVEIVAAGGPHSRLPVALFGLGGNKHNEIAPQLVFGMSPPSPTSPCPGLPEAL